MSTQTRERAEHPSESMAGSPAPEQQPDQTGARPEPIRRASGSGSNGQQPMRPAKPTFLAAAGTNGQRRILGAASSGDVSSASAYRELRVFAELFADVQQTRIACGHRANRCIRCMHIPKDHQGPCGKEDCDCPNLFLLDPGQLKPQLDMLAATEHQLGLAMVRCYRRVVDQNIRTWQQDTTGIGEHLLARLLGTIGHPRHATPYHWEGQGPERVLIADPPFERNVAKLWAYCGHGDPDRKRRKGMTAEDGAALGNPRAKMLVHLLAEAAMKCVGSAAINLSAPIRATQPADAQNAGSVARLLAAPTDTSRPTRARSPYRDTYEEARLRFADRDWTPAHQHAAALRSVGKEILRDLWVAAGDRHGSDAIAGIVPGGQPISESQSRSAAGDHVAGESRRPSVPGDHLVADAQPPSAAGEILQARATNGGVLSRTEGD
jgi:hypothetical protein